ncbi:MAG: SusC/RagA family TonB-linked outer membrane protein [Bacteroidales bacterium]|nr:SusC/RagA family TonB-linked outer membrane protein [Bacteroidales bacterium]MBN2817460.1 SusC/RagA family TonB-linked outer membrane protein [Bacteroidales bacterium]
MKITVINEMKHPKYFVFMTHKHLNLRILATYMLVAISSFVALLAQDTGGYKLYGTILESGTGKPIEQAIVSVASATEYTNSDAEGKFTLDLPTKTERIIVTYPGYHTDEIFTNGQELLVIYLTPSENISENELYSSPFGTNKLREATNSITLLPNSAFEHTSAASANQILSGKVAGLNVVEHSGMPGHSSWMNLRGISSIFGRNEPLVFIDGLIHEVNFPNNYRIEGFLFNPLNVVDVDDIIDYTINKTGEGYLGSTGSNGVIYINTEQKKETSATIKISSYGGVSLPPATLEVLNADQFRSYYNSMINSEGYSLSELDKLNAWKYEYYRYGNKTDWQKEQFQPAPMQKYHIFLKGGDDIATYNISTGYVRQGAVYDQWSYSRYNLRLNGKINITKRLTILPNTKLALADVNLSNMGPTTVLNPVASSVLKSPLMTAHERSTTNGTELYPYDDVGAFNISNPAVLIDKALGSDRNFQLLTSANVVYSISPKLSISHIIGITVNNDRINIFIPDIGVVQIDSAKNSPQDMVTEYRSNQNHTTLNYKNTYNTYHHLNIHAGIRNVSNSYKNSQSIDLNTPSDDFRSLGQGAEYSYLRTQNGDLNEVKWLSYFANADYNFRDKYYLCLSTSLDASSVFNSENRYNFYPSVFGAWRLSSSEFMKNNTKINDLKVRASFAQTGNMFSNIYQYSKLTYTGSRFQNVSAVVMDYNPNKEMKAERKSTLNTGIDMTTGKNAVNFHLDYYMSFVNNLIINQQLPYNFGFTDYYDNGGKLATSGIEFATDARLFFGESELLLGATVTKQKTKITGLEFINPETEFLTREVVGGEYVAMVDNPINAFYGYKTLGIYNSDVEANGIIGPNGWPMSAGDVIFEDVDGNNIIDDKDKQIIGDPNPMIFGGLTADLKIKRFKFSTLFTYSVGNDIYNYLRYKMTAMEDFSNQSTDVLNRWQAESPNPAAELPRLALGDPNGNNAFSDRWIEDGSYLKLKQLTVSYNTPRIFSLRKEATLYLTASNLYTLTKYSGYDPETMYLSNPYYMGIDYGKIPQTISVIIGIQISL